MRSRFKSLIGIAAAWAGISASATARAETVDELSVETATPDALCPDLAATRQAVRDRIGQLSLDGGRWVARYTIGHDPGGGGDYVELVLKDGAGKVRLERRIPFSGESCDTVAQAIALVLERHFRELQQPSNTDANAGALDDASSAEDTAPPAARSSASSPAAPISTAKAPAEPLAPPLELSALGGYGFGRNTGTVGLGLGYWFSRSLRVSLSGAFLLPLVNERVLDDQGGGQGQAELIEVPLRASLAWGVRRATWSAHVGPEIVVAIDRANTRDLESNTSGTGLSFSAGGATGGTYWLSPSVGLTALVAVDATLKQTDFQVRAGTTVRSVLVSPSPQGWGLLGVTFGVTP